MLHGMSNFTTKVNFGGNFNFDYESIQNLTLVMILTYDNCIYNLVLKWWMFKLDTKEALWTKYFTKLKVLAYKCLFCFAQELIF